MVVRRLEAVVDELRRPKGVSWAQAWRQVLDVLLHYPLGASETMLRNQVFVAPPFNAFDAQQCQSLRLFVASRRRTIAEMKSASFRCRVVDVRPIAPHSSALVMELTDADADEGSFSIASFIHGQFLSAAPHWRNFVLRLTSCEKRFSRLLPTQHVVVELPLSVCASMFGGRDDIVFARILRIGPLRRSRDSRYRVGQCVNLEGTFRGSRGLISWILSGPIVALVQLLRKGEVVALMNPIVSSQSVGGGGHVMFIECGAHTIVHVITAVTLNDVLSSVFSSSSNLLDESCLGVPLEASQSDLSQTVLSGVIDSDEVEEFEGAAVKDMDDIADRILIRDLRKHAFVNISLLAVITEKHCLSPTSLLVHLDDGSEPALLRIDSNCWDTCSEPSQWLVGHLLWISRVRSSSPREENLNALSMRSTSTTRIVNISTLQGFLRSPFVYECLRLRDAKQRKESFVCCALVSRLVIEEDASGHRSFVMFLDDAEERLKVSASVSVLEYLLETNAVAFDMMDVHEQRRALSYKFRSSLLNLFVTKTPSGFRADIANDFNVRVAVISLLQKLE